MDLWHPPTDEPHLLEWWYPLITASRTLREARYPWLIHVDQMMLMGRVDRAGRPAVWVYKHTESRGELYLDATGQAYTFTRTPNGRSVGRFTRCDLTAALWRADLPRFVDPVFYEEPMRQAPTTWGADEDLDDAPADAPAPAPREPRRRGHLTVIDGGRHQPIAG